MREQSKIMRENLSLSDGWTVPPRVGDTKCQVKKFTENTENTGYCWMLETEDK